MNIEDYNIIVQNAKYLLESGLNAKEWEVQFASAEAFASLKSDIGIDIILAGCKSQNPCIRDRAVQALGNLEDATYTNDIAALLKDEDDSTHAHALEAYAKVEPNKIIPLLRKSFVDKYFITMESAINVANDIEENKGDCILKKALSLDYVPYRLQILAAGMLAKKNNESGLDFLKMLITHRDSWLRFLGARELAYLKNDAGKNILVERVQNGDWESKIMALEALIFMDCQEEWIENLKRPWEAPKQMDRLNIIRILDQFKPEKTKSLLTIEWNDSKEEERVRILEIIGELKRPELLEIAEDVIKRGPEYQRAILLKSIAKMNDISLLPRIFPILQKSHWLVQILASKIVLQMQPLIDCI